MKILAVHNYYEQAGGEDATYEHEIHLLQQAGHQIVTYQRTNKEIKEMSLLDKAYLPFQTIWSAEAYKELSALLKKEKPDLAHFHNTHLMISPSAYYACRTEGIPLVQSLDNPRLLCPSANFFRDGHLCQDCLNKTPPWPGVLHACYRGSHLQTAVVAAMLTTHRWLGTWQDTVDLYLVATHFYKEKFTEGGLPANKIFVKPHFVDPDPGPRKTVPGDYALFIGRLDPEKGIPTLLNAWEKLKHIPLKIRGSGKLISLVQAARDKNEAIDLVDQLSKKELLELIKGARFLVWPSEGYYETFGFVAAEAFACGVPVIASRIGVMQEMVTDQGTGLHFIPGDSDDLAEKVTWAWEHPEEMVAMGKNARQEFMQKYTAENNYEQLMKAYALAIESANRQHKAR